MWVKHSKTCLYTSQTPLSRWQICMFNYELISPCVHKTMHLQHCGAKGRRWIVLYYSLFENPVSVSSLSTFLPRKQRQKPTTKTTENDTFPWYVVWIDSAPFTVSLVEIRRRTRLPVHYNASMASPKLQKTDTRSKHAQLSLFEPQGRRFTNFYYYYYYKRLKEKHSMTFL